MGLNKLFQRVRAPPRPLYEANHGPKHTNRVESVFLNETRFLKIANSSGNFSQLFSLARSEGLKLVLIVYGLANSRDLSAVSNQRAVSVDCRYRSTSVL